MLPGVKLAHLRTLLGFIYTGEVKVSEDELPDLLEVAEMLGVRGLKANKDDEDVEGEEDKEEQEDQLRKDGESKDTPQEEDEAEKQKESVKNSDSTPSLKPPTPEPLLLKMEPNLPSDPPKTPMEEEDQEAGQELEEEKEDGAEDPPPVKAEPIVTASAAATPKPSYPGLQSQYGYMAPYMSPLVSMSNLAAMYQQVCSSSYMNMF